MYIILAIVLGQNSIHISSQPFSSRHSQQSIWQFLVSFSLLPDLCLWNKILWGKCLLGRPPVEGECSPRALWVAGGCGMQGAFGAKSSGSWDGEGWTHRHRVRAPQSAWAAIRKYHRPGGLKSRRLFLTVLGAERPKARRLLGSVSGDSLLLATQGQLLAVSSHGRRSKQSGVSSYKSTNLMVEDPPS